MPTRKIHLAGHAPEDAGRDALGVNRPVPPGHGTAVCLRVVPLERLTEDFDLVPCAACDRRAFL